jgi:hypothetical protein
LVSHFLLLTIGLVCSVLSRCSWSCSLLDCGAAARCSSAAQLLTAYPPRSCSLLTLRAAARCSPAAQLLAAHLLRSCSLLSRLAAARCSPHKIKKKYAFFVNENTGKTFKWTLTYINYWENFFFK